MPASISLRIPADTPCRPISTATRGMSLRVAAAATIASATSFAWMPRGGMKDAMTASTPGSCRTSVSTSRYVVAVAEAMRSTGLRTTASSGTRSRMARCVSGVSSTTLSPADSHASVRMMAGPPALLTMATRLPRGSGRRGKAIA